MSFLRKNIIWSLVLFFGASFHVSNAFAAKCKGVSTQWVNDCASSAYGGHECAYGAQGDFHPEEWLKMGKKQCNFVTQALKNQVVKDYLLQVRDDVVAGKSHEEPAALSCNKEEALCAGALEFVKNKKFTDYRAKILKGTLVAKKRGKSFAK